MFEPDSNPDGVRCTLQDYMVNVFGRRPQDGYAARPFDNAGIQYGLGALEAGSITADQFVDLNVQLGGADMNGDPQPARMEADRPALGYLYRTGAVNNANNLDQVAIIDLRGPDPGAFHDAYRVYALRARLDREFGHHDNHVLWRGFAPIVGGVDYASAAILAMDRWLSAVEGDTRAVPQAQKLVENKPDELVDRCTEGAGLGAELPAEPCDAVVSVYSTPRMAAGMPSTDDVMKCERGPVRSFDYPVELGEDALAQLEAAFPGGVCDYSKPGVDVTPTIPWLTYTGGPGGQPLGPPPVSEPVAAAGVAAARSAPAPGAAVLGAQVEAADDPEVAGRAPGGRGPSVLPVTGLGLLGLAWVGLALLVTGVRLAKRSRI